jgi:glycerol-3-phosphate dehydrogenase
VVTDPPSAEECYRENGIIRKIAASCVEETEGLYVALPEDGLEYQREFLTKCEAAGIPVDLLTPAQALAFEPNLSREVIGAVKTPDASVNPFTLAGENARAARERGGKVMNHTPVTGLLVEGGRVTGVRAFNAKNRETFEASSEFVINAAGAWAHEVVNTIGLAIPLAYSKGSIIIFNRRLIETVLARCRHPGDGDVIVPNETTSLFGTTSIRVDELDGLIVEPDEVRLLLRELEKMVPACPSARLIRAFSGVRPLFKQVETDDDRELSRGFAIIDHEEKEGLEGLVSIVGGKLSTYRLMAEKTVDVVCDKLGVTGTCTTHLDPLPSSRKTRFMSLGERLRKTDPENIKDPQKDAIVCECELVNRREIEEAIREAESSDLNDIRMRTRMGTGPCQGTFCSYKTLGIMAEMGKLDDPFPNDSLKGFIERRWKGIKPIIGGDQLKEEQLTEGIYAGLLNLDKDETLSEPKASERQEAE